MAVTSIFHGKGVIARRCDERPQPESPRVRLGGLTRRGRAAGPAPQPPRTDGPRRLENQLASLMVGLRERLDRYIGIERYWD